MPGQIDSSTRLNFGSGGDLVRDVTVTTDAGVAVKQQVMSLGDPVVADNLLQITPAGQALTASIVEQEMLLELRKISAGIQLLLAQFMGEMPDLEGVI